MSLDIMFYITIYVMFNRKLPSCPEQVAQLVGVSSSTPRGCRFNPRSGHIPKL